MTPGNAAEENSDEANKGMQWIDESCCLNDADANGIPDGI